MPGHTYLYRRGAVYYHRAAVPTDIRETYGKREETFSLKTRDYHEALRLVKLAAVETDRKFEAHRRQLRAKREAPLLAELTELEIKRLGRRYYTDLLAEDDEVRAEGTADEQMPTVIFHNQVDADTTEPGEDNVYPIAPASGTVVDNDADTSTHQDMPFPNAPASGTFHVGVDAPEQTREVLNRLITLRLSTPPSFEHRANDIKGLMDASRQDYARGRVNDHYLFEAEDLLNRENFNLTKGSPSLQKLALELVKATIQADEVMLKRAHGEIIETPEADHQFVKPQPAAPLLSEVAEAWIKEKSQTSWVKKTADEERVWIAHFITVCGDKPLSEYGKADGRAFKSMLMKLPANWTKRKQLKGLSVVKAAEKAAKLGLPPRATKTINNKLNEIGGFWRWAANHYDNCPANPMAGLQLKIKTSPRDQRKPFTIDELRAIFTAPLYTGCRSFHFWKQPGDMVLRESARYWVPLISLYTGARMGEILQLRTNEVGQESGLSYFDIHDETKATDKKIKTNSSWRRIPVHDTLQELGLMDLVKTRREQGEERLFPDAQLGKDGYYSSPFSKYFTNFLKATGVKHKRNSFHSFRHNFEDACRNSGIPLEVMNALQGHTEAGMAGRYGQGYLVKFLAQEMKKIRYEGLDLGHLGAYRRAS